MQAIIKFTLLIGIISSPVLADHDLSKRNPKNGKALYQGQCASCHGANLEGQPDWRTPNEDGILPAPPHDESGHTWHHDTGLLFEYTKFGGKGALAARGITDFNSGMPAFGDLLSDDEIMDILSYIYSTWPARAQESQTNRGPIHN